MHVCTHAFSYTPTHSEQTLNAHMHSHTHAHTHMHAHTHIYPYMSVHHTVTNFMMIYYFFKHSDVGLSEKSNHTLFDKILKETITSTSSPPQG